MSFSWHSSGRPCSRHGCECCELDRFCDSFMNSSFCGCRNSYGYGTSCGSCSNCGGSTSSSTTFNPAHGCSTGNSSSGIQCRAASGCCHARPHHTGSNSAPKVASRRAASPKATRPREASSRLRPIGNHGSSKRVAYKNGNGGVVPATRNGTMRHHHPSKKPEGSETSWSSTGSSSSS